MEFSPPYAISKELWLNKKFFLNGPFQNTEKTEGLRLIPIKLFCKKPVPNNFPKFTGKHLSQSNFLLTCLIIALHFYLKQTPKNVRATSKTWTRTLDSDPGPWKTWTLISLDSKKPGPWKTWTLKCRWNTDRCRKQSEDHLA